MKYFTRKILFFLGNMFYALGHFCKALAYAMR